MFKNIIVLVLAAATANAASDPSLASRVTQAIASVTGNGITGNFNFTQESGQSGLKVAINVSGLKQGTQYPFHIHINVVPPNGNCTATGGHLDTFGVKTANAPYNCSKNNALTTCELGDLAGRQGNITVNANGQGIMTFNDPIITFGEGKTSILGHSVVIHAPDNTRLACGNIVGYALQVPASGSASSPAASHSGSSQDEASGLDPVDSAITTKTSGSAVSAALSAALVVLGAAIAL
ncbi:hypothetical protein GGI04_000647 [Coemansia thaxteri]|nr:hypothetical protein GGI04_000647 [Coemansia thaxteri]